MRLLYTWCILACMLLMTGDAAGWWRRRRRRTRICNRNSFVNGCTLPVKWLPFKKTFTPACNKHDVCYTCAAAHGLSRASCDRRFLNNMMKICRRKWWLPFCRKASKAYYLGTKIFGRKYFKTHASSGCNAHWVKKCL